MEKGYESRYPRFTWRELQEEMLIRKGWRIVRKEETRALFDDIQRRRRRMQQSD